MDVKHPRGIKVAASKKNNKKELGEIFVRDHATAFFLMICGLKE